MRLWKPIFTIMMIALLSACGGSSDKDSTDNSNDRNILGSTDDSRDTPSTTPSEDEDDNNPNTTTDKTAPIITISGDNPTSITQNRAYIDAGATATDNIDGTVTVKSTGSVDTSTIGAYTITYTATDQAGNKATTKRIVNVIKKIIADTTPPVITLSGDNPLEITQGEIFSDLGATATDNIDSTVTVKSTGSVDTSTIGAYTITYTATDQAGNKATTKRIVNVIKKIIADTTPPVITLSGDNPLEITQGEIFSDLGATATDNIDSTVTVKSTGSVDTSTIGEYTITYTATDSAGNRAMIRRIVNVNANNIIFIANAGEDKTTKVNEPTSIIGEGTYNSGSIISYEWKEGDIVLSTMATFEYLPTIEGTHTLTFSIINDNGETTHDNLIITVTAKNNLSTLSNGLVAYYEFEGNAKDSSGYGNDGIEYGGVSYSNGVIGQASSLDGIDDYINLKNVYFNKNTTTISMWIKAEISNNVTDFLSKHTDESDVSLLIRQEADGKYDAEWTINNTFYDLSRDISNSYNDNIGLIKPNKDMFDNLILIYDGNQILFYVNNKLIKKVSPVNGSIVNNSHDLILGASSANTNGEHGKFAIDDLRIYNRALNQAEITELYKLGQQKKVNLIKKLVAHYEFEGNATDSKKQRK